MTFKEKLKILRKSKRLTQDDFAAAIGVSRQAVYKWECGQSYPEVPKLLEMKLLLGISIDDLLDDSYDIPLPEKKRRRRISKEAKAEIEANVAKGVNPAAAAVAPVEAPVAPKAPKAAPKPKAPAAPKAAPAPAPAPVAEAPKAAPVVEEPKAAPAPVAAPAPAAAPVVEEPKAAPAPVAEEPKAEPAPAAAPEAPKAEEAAADTEKKKSGFFGRFFGKK